jgi:phage terminase large subunit-like protein
MVVPLLLSAIKCDSLLKTVTHKKSFTETPPTSLYADGLTDYKGTQLKRIVVLIYNL